MIVSLHANRIQMWWRINSLIPDKAFDLFSPEVWACLHTAAEKMFDDYYGWTVCHLTPFSAGLIADWLEEYGDKVRIKSVNNTDAPTAAEVIAALRQKYAELSGLAKQAHPTPN